MQETQQDQDVTANERRAQRLPTGEEALEQFDPLIRMVVSWRKWRFDPHTQQDVCQWIRMELIKCLPDFRGTSSIEYYVKRICINKCISAIRKQRRDREVLVPTISEEKQLNGKDMALKDRAMEDPVRFAVLAERGEAVRNLITTLDPICRTAVSQYYLEGLPYEEIADRNGISLNTVGSRLSKCLQKLRRMIRDDQVLRDDFHG